MLEQFTNAEGDRAYIIPQRRGVIVSLTPQRTSVRPHVFDDREDAARFLQRWGWKAGVGDG